VTRGCPLLGLLSMKSITSCHAPEPPPPTLRYAHAQHFVIPVIIGQPKLLNFQSFLLQNLGV
jgi:hypothetical protein